MNKILMLILTLTLLSCQHTPDNFFKDKQNSAKFVYEKATGPDGIERDYISIEKSVCFERDYEISLEFIGSRSEVSLEKNIKECNLLRGFSPQRNKKLVDFYKWIRLQISQGHAILPEELQN